ncbi:1732_t:CDS:2, partial [Paraglomus occultum]
RTGVTVPNTVKKDSEGFDEIDDFFAKAIILKRSTPVRVDTPPPTTRFLTPISFENRQSLPSPSPLPPLTTEDTLTENLPDKAFDFGISQNDNTPGNASPIYIESTPVRVDTPPPADRFLTPISFENRQSLPSPSPLPPINVEDSLTEKSPAKAFDFGIGQNNNTLGDASSNINRIKTKTKPKVQSTDKPIKRKQKKVEKKPPPDNQHENKDIVDEEPPGLRRSKRQRLKPVEYWRNEKVVYEMRKSVGVPVQVVKDVIRITSDDEETNTKTKEGGVKKRKGNNKASGSSSHREPKAEDIEKPTSPEAMVIDFGTNKEIKRSIVATTAMLNPIKSSGKAYKMQKLFNEGSFMAYGVVEIPRDTEKPSKSSKDTALVFYVAKGPVKVTIHKYTFHVGTGDQFFVPRGNYYTIKNENHYDIRLFWSSAKEV